jgi:CHAT domain-containing protein
MSGMRGKDSLQVSILQDSIFRLSERYLALKRETSAKFFETSGELRFAGIRDIQKAIDDSTAVIAYNVAPERIFYFLITKNDFEFIMKRESRDDLERDVGHIRRLIYYRQTGDYIDYAQDLESKLIPKLDDDIKKLVIIPDGVLNTLPYEVLLRGRVRVKDKNNLKSFPYLIRSYDISYAYSASLMFGSPLKNLKEEARGLVAFAPVFSKTAEDGLSLTNKQVILASTDSVSQRSVLKEGRSINPLPATETEVQAIYDIFTRQKQPAQIFTHTMAAEEEAKAASISGYKYIHFATHGFVNTTHPELSGLILSQNKTSAEDGILYSGELYNLPLQADLVTLSACETGLGKIEAGEGVIGLPRALLYAGAKNVLVSLWKVADASTSQLMVDFYSRFLSGQSYSSALRQAKLRMIASPEYANPYYWSPFILIGK